jgi:hypothetical protein
MKSTAFTAAAADAGGSFDVFACNSGAACGTTYSPPVIVLRLYPQQDKDSQMARSFQSFRTKVVSVRQTHAQRSSRR